MSKRTEIYECEKLYEEVWKKPVLVVANRYGVSNVALAKVCRKLVVPLPPRGYWARIRAGRKPLFPCLASNHFKELELRILRMHYHQHGDMAGIRFAPEETPTEDQPQ